MSLNIAKIVQQIMEAKPEAGVAARQLAIGSVLTVGAGRGFVIATKNDRRYVITAAHCLPHLPPPNPAMYLEEMTYPSLLAAHPASAFSAQRVERAAPRSRECQ